MKKFKDIDNVLNQKGAVPTIAVIGFPETQFDFINALVDKNVAKCILLCERGSSPMSIPFDILFDERIGENTNFAIRISTKLYAAKTIHAKVMHVMAWLFAHNHYITDLTLGAMTEQEFSLILEPIDCFYNLRLIADEITLEEFREAVFQPLKAIEGATVSFEKRVNDKKKELRHKGIVLPFEIVREMVFDDMWNELKPETTGKYHAWLYRIGEIVREYLSSLMGNQPIPENGSVDCVVESDCKSTATSILSKLLDASQLFNLIVRSFTIVCRPRKELKTAGAFHVCFRFMSMNKNRNFMQALDFSLNGATDGILVLADLEKQGIELVSANVVQKLSIARLGIPFHVMFTGVKDVVSNFVSKHVEDIIMVRQEDYDSQIGDAIRAIEEVIAECSDSWPVDGVSWNSIRFFDENIDSVQKAVRKQDPSKLQHFKPAGFYSEIRKLVETTQKVLFSCSVDVSLGIGQLSVNLDGSGIPEKVVDALTVSKAITHQYLLKNKVYAVMSHDVIAYYERLQQGQGYRCDEFKINMKGAVRRVLRDTIPSLTELFDSQAVQVEDELRGPLREFFSQTEVYRRVLDRVAFRLSYGNPVVRDAIDKVYNEPAAFITTLFNMQEKFKEVFGTPEFRAAIAEELGSALTSLYEKRHIELGC